MAGEIEMKTIDVSEKADALRFRFWTAMIQNQPNAIQKFEDYSNPDDIREKLDEWRWTMTLSNEVFKAIRPLE